MATRSTSERAAIGQLISLSEMHRALREAADVPAFFAEAAGHAGAILGYGRAIVLAVGEAGLEAGVTGALGDPESDRLRRVLLTAAVPLRRGTREARVVRQPDAEPARNGPSRLADTLELQHCVYAAIAPEGRTLALLVLDRSSVPVSALDARVAGVCGRLIAGSLEQVVTRLRAADLASELRQFSASARALASELLDAPVALQPTPQYGRTFADIGSVPGPGFEGVLTDQELRIAALLADGMSNPEIAERLVLSTETVKSHVSRILRKLDAANRVEAATKFLRLTRA